MESSRPDQHYLRVATACPEVSVADVETNVQQISELYAAATEQACALVVFPELSITGYSIGDLVRFSGLLNKAKRGLETLADCTLDKQTAMIVGLPLEVGNAIYNCAAVIAEGQVKGIVPKKNLPTYGEFYEKRWFQRWDQPNTEVEISGQKVPFGTDMLFDIGGVETGVEICEDLWVTDPPSRLLAEHGALVIANPSASPELVGKAGYRRQLVGQQSARLIVAYAYAGSDSSESTMDVVMGGHQIIAENGQMSAERPLFTRDGTRLLRADIDIDHLRHDRRRDTNFPNRMGMMIVSCTVNRPEFIPEPHILADPFSGKDSAEHAERLQEAFDIISTSLAQYIHHENINYVNLGLSGGLDSTLALLVALRASRILGRDPKDMVRTLTMPGMGSSDRTQTNAQKLAAAFDLRNEVLPIEELARVEMQLLNHDGVTQDITFENIQARARTALLFNYGNKNGGLVQGTGDLSEIALGYSTYNGDHSSGYNPQCNVAKTQVAHMVRYISTLPEFEPAKAIIDDILDTPFSAELKRTEGDEMSQITEEIIGPYSLHEFFATYLVRWGDEPAKVQFMAERAFAGRFEPSEIAHWLAVFKQRFIGNRFKTVALPSGPKIGSLALDTRSNFRIPADLPNTALWD